MRSVFVVVVDPPRNRRKDQLLFQNYLSSERSCSSSKDDGLLSMGHRLGERL